MFKKKEKGFALILSLILLLAMSLMGGALIVITSGDHRSNNNSDQYQQVFYVAETGLMQGEKWVIDNYLGHWMTTVPPASESLGDRPDEAAAGAEYDAAVASYNTITAAYIPGEGGYFRHTFDRGPARNDTDRGPNDKSTCMNSFKNIDAAENILIAGKGKLPKKENFINIVGPLLLSEDCGDYETCTNYRTENLEENDRDGWDNAKLQKIVESEVGYLKRFEYEFFVINAGSAAYRAEGSSIATTTSNIDTQGTAYKVYSCGIFYGESTEDDELNDGNVQILIPLETLVVMPN
tara:strand:+ start:2607 stop:3488 length:882 start_codon:yes stop_codon:yes gene_type:complete